MMVFSGILFFIVFVISQAVAGDITYTYLVYVSSFNAETLTALKSKGYNTNDIPLKITRVLTQNNTNYLLLKVTPKNNLEKSVLDSNKINGKISLLSTSEYISEYNGRTGGVERRIDRIFYSKPPNDMDKNWATYISSP